MMCNEGTPAMPVQPASPVSRSRKDDALLFGVAVDVLIKDGGLMSTDTLARAIAESFWAPPDYAILGQRLLLALQDGLAQGDARFQRVTANGSPWRDKTSLREAMRPLLLWHTNFWVVIRSCYLYAKRADLVNMAERLALCMLMLTLLPEEARRKRLLRLRALARKAKRAPKPLPDDTDPRRVFFKACPASNQPAQLNGPAGNSCGDQSGPACDQVQGSSSDEVARCPLCSGPAVLPASPSPLPGKREHNATQATPATSDDEPDPLVSTPSVDRGSTDSGPQTPMQLRPLDPRAPVHTQQGGNGFETEQQVPSSHPLGDNLDVPEGPQSASGPDEKGRSGTVVFVEEATAGLSGTGSLELVHCPGSSASAGEDSKDSTWVPSSPGESPKKRKRGQQAGTLHQVLQRTREKRKGEFGGSYAMTRKALRHSEDQKGVHNHVGASGGEAEPAMAGLGAIQNLSGPHPEQTSAGVSQAGAALGRKGQKTVSKQQVVVVRNRPAGKTGYYGVTKQSNRYSAHIHAQGKKWPLGTFSDPVSAALRYDQAAIKLRGAAAAVNFPLGCISRPNAKAVHHGPAQLPLGKPRGRGRPPTNRRLPAGSVKGNLASALGIIAPRMGRRTPGRSGYFGVSERHGRYVAQIVVEGRPQYLKSFSHPVDAAICYDREAIKLRGDQANLNFPPGYTPGPTSAGASGRPGGGGRGLKRPAANGLLPAVKVEGQVQTPEVQVVVARNRPAGKSGYYGVTQHRNRYVAHIHSQGAKWHLGSFPDPVSAAICYDKEATEVRGAAAALNFPPGAIRGPTATAAPRGSAVLPAGKGRGRGRPPKNGLVPAGNAQDRLVPGILATKKRGPGVVPKRTPGKSGYFGVSKRGNRYAAQLVVEGKFRHLGLFPDPVSAATFYDRQAIRIRGDRALLNFPPGCTPGRTSIGATGHLLEVTGGGGRGLKRPAAIGLLPAGEVEGETLPAPRPQAHCKNLPGKSGYYGVCAQGNQYCAHIFVEGKKVHLGSFPDPVSAATRYDQEALKVRGARALLNFPSSCIRKPISGGVNKKPRGRPPGGGSGKKVRAANGPLPAGTPESKGLPLLGPKALHERRPGSTGFHGVVLYRGRYEARFRQQDNTVYLGSFLNLVGAAKRYDEEALKVHGASAILNFPRGGKRKPGPKVGGGWSAALPGGGGFKQEDPATDASPPAGNPTPPVPETLGIKKAHRRVVRKKPRGASGYYGVTPRGAKYLAQLTFKGDYRYIGTFTDPLTAAIRYDEEAIKACGADAVLNFPPGCNPNTTSTCVDSGSHVLPGGEACGQEGTVANDSVPAGKCTEIQAVSVE